MRKATFLFLVFILSFSVFRTSAQGFLHTQDKLIVNGKGDEIQLRGMGLGGWMLQEGYMLQISKNGTQHAIKQRIVDLIGQEDCERFYDEWLHRVVKKSDIDSLAHWGFNSIRLPMHYKLFTLPVEQEPVKGENTWLQKGFELTDSLLSWCKANKIYLILDLHAAPGGEGKDANISDYDPEKPSVWESDANKQKTVALWEKLATRYASEPWIGGYDLINEPNWTWEGKQINGTQDTLNTAIWALYQDITKAIRRVDKNHIIFIEGNGWANNYKGFPGIWDSNMVISFHKYWNFNNQESIAQFIALRDKYQVPLWLGESGENSNQWFVDCIGLMERNHIGWSWWTLKKVGSFACPLHIQVPPEYPLLTSYWNQGGPKPSKEVATKALFQLTENVKSEHCFFVKDFVDAMFRQVTDTMTLPYRQHLLPGKVNAVDYDLGRQGYAYCDSDFQNVPGNKNRWNRGGVYRNDGVDIERTVNPSPENCGYYVFSTKKGEWLTYTVQAAQSGNYKILFSAASEKEPGAVQFIVDSNELAPTTVGVTGDKEKFVAVPAGKVSMTAGVHRIKLLIVKGGINLNYVEFVKD